MKKIKKMTRMQRKVSALSVVMRVTLCVVTSLMLAGNVAAGIVPVTRDECVIMRNNGVITSDNPVPCERLSRVSFQYVNLAGKTEMGNVVVLDVVSEQVEAIFSKLFTIRFPIHKSVVMENYQGDDNASMADNNTSAFNGRAITNGKTWSKHAYGVAVDLNPLQNPFLGFSANGEVNVSPAASAKSFVNRKVIRTNKQHRSGMIDIGIIDIFSRHGFLTWGGDWDQPIDYQHFEIGSQKFVDSLLKQTPGIAKKTFERYAADYRQCISESSQTDVLKRQVCCIEKIRQ